MGQPLQAVQNGYKNCQTRHHGCQRAWLHCCQRFMAAWGAASMWAMMRFSRRTEWSTEFRVSVSIFRKMSQILHVLFPDGFIFRFVTGLQIFFGVKRSTDHAFSRVRGGLLL